MKRNGRRKRERLFRLYAANLAIYHPELSDVFACPICRTGFRREHLDARPSALSIAHVMPSSVSKGPVTLSCRKCNNTFGFKYDSHRRKAKDDAEWGSGKRKIRATVRNEGGRFTADWLYKDNTFHVIQRRNESAPGGFDGFVEHLKAHEDATCTITWSMHSVARWRVSVLHSAFLAMFSIFGYEYVLSPWVGRARSLVCEDQDAERLAKIIGTTRSLPAGDFALSIVTEPSDRSCFVLALPTAEKDGPRTSVLLPGLGPGADEAYDALLDSDTHLKSFRAKIVLDGLRGPRLDDPTFCLWGCRLWRDCLRSA